jgi:hypothetical protein
MPRVEFEPTTPVFERTKTVHALDRAATVTDTHSPTLIILIVKRLAYVYYPRSVLRK